MRIERILSPTTISAAVSAVMPHVQDQRTGCVQKDDMNLILDKMLSATRSSIATPLYSFDFPAQMKPLVDRHMCLIKKPLLRENARLSS